MTYYTIYDTYNMLLSGSPSISQVVPTASTISDSNNDDTDPSALSSGRPIEDSDEKQLDDTCNLKINKRPRTENNNPNGARNNRKRGKKKSLAFASSWPWASLAEDSCSLFVRGLPRFTSEEALADFFGAMFQKVGSTSAHPRCFIRRHKDDARVVLSNPRDVTWALKFGDRLFRGVELEFLPWNTKTSPTFGGKPSDENESLGYYVPSNYDNDKESVSTVTVESEFPDGRRHEDDSRSVLSDDYQGNHTSYENDINSSHVVSEGTATYASLNVASACQNVYPRASPDISEPLSSYNSRHKDDHRVVFPDADQTNNLRCNGSHKKESNAALSSSAYKGSSKWDKRAPSDMHESTAATTFVRSPRDNIQSDFSDHDQGYYGPSNKINNTFNVLSEDVVANTSQKVHANACTFRGEALPSFSSLCKDKYDSYGIQNDKDRNGGHTSSSSYHVLEEARATTSPTVANTIGECLSSSSSNAPVVVPSCFIRRRKRNARVVFSDDVQVHSLEYDGSYGTCRNLSNVLNERVGVSAFTTVRESEEASKDGTHLSHVGPDVSRVPHHEGDGNVAFERLENTADNEVDRLREELRLAQEKYQRDLIAAQVESEKKLSQKEADFVAERTSIQHQHEQDMLAVQKRLDSSEKDHSKEKSELVRRLTDAKEQLKLLQDLMEKQQKDKDTLQITLNRQKEEFKKNLKESYAKKFLYAKDQIASDTSALTKEIGTLKKQLDAANKKIATLSSVAHENSQRKKQSDTTTKKSTEQLHESSETMLAWKIKTEETSTKISELETKLHEAKKENEKLMKENEEAMKNQKESFAKLKASTLQEKKLLVKKYASEKQVLQQQIEQLSNESDQRRESSAQSLDYSTNVDVQALQERIEQLTKEKQYMEQKNIDTTISMSKQITASFDQKELLKEQLKREKALRLAAEAQLDSFGSRPDASSNSPCMSAETTRIKRSNSPPTVSNDTSVDFGDYDV